MKNKNTLQMIIAIVAILATGRAYGSMVDTNYLAEDTAIIQDSSYSGGNDNTFIAGTLSGKINRPLLKAANPDVPGGYEITNATLYILQETYGGGAPMDLYAMNTIWDESNADWSNKTVSTMWSAAGMAAGVDYNSTIINSAIASGWTAFNVTTEVQAFINGTKTNYGWFMKRTSEASFTRFRTVNDGDRNQWPYLKVEYGQLTDPAVTITNTVTDDTHIGSANPNSTAGTGTTFLMGNLSGVYRGLIKCTVTNIPPNANILSADLWLYQDYANGENNFVDIHRILKDWNEGSATWNSNTVSSAWSTPGLGAGTDYQTTATDTSYMPLAKYVPFDVTDDIKVFYNGSATNYGWVLINQKESSADLTRFRSKEAALNLRPSLVIRYHVPEGTVVTVR